MHSIKPKRKRFKFYIKQLHLWLGLTSGLFVCFLGITGCTLAFQREIEDLTQGYRFVQKQDQPYLEPSKLNAIADLRIPGKKGHSVSYQEGRASQVLYFSEAPDYYWIAFLNPYSGEVLKVKNMNEDFFKIMIDGHYYLWLPANVGQPVLASATLMFFFLLLSGLVLWWPKNVAARKKRFSIKWNAKWKRLNYDLHNVLGFYMTWILIFIAFSGLVMGFQWFARSAYWIGSGGEKMIDFTESESRITPSAVQTSVLPIDVLWAGAIKKLSNKSQVVEVHIPEGPKSSIEIALNPDADTYWKTDYLYYDQYSFKEIPVKHPYGKLAEAGSGDKLLRMNYDIHVGAIAGFPGKCMAFLASLIAASLPITGFLIWRGRKKKKPAF